MNKSVDEIDMKKEQNLSKSSIIGKGWVNVEADAPLKIWSKEMLETEDIVEWS